MNIRRQLRNTILGALPKPLVEHLRDLRKRSRRVAWEKRVRDNPNAVVGTRELVESLHELGLEPGRDLIVHSAMSKIGLLEDGADTIIDALLEVIGPDATLVMPAYPMRASMLDTMLDPTPFRVKHDRSWMGKITEVFRQRDGVLRSAHPTHSVAAFGPSADFYVRDHHKSCSPCGVGSPFMRLWERDAQILCIGIGIARVTSHHVIEDRLDTFPIDVYLERTYLKDVEFADGRIESVEVRVHRPELSAVRIEKIPAVEQEILELMRQMEIIKEGPLGMTRAYSFGARDLDEMLEARLEAKGTTIYAL